MSHSHSSKFHRIVDEVLRHLPYSIFGVTMSLVLMGILTFVADISGAGPDFPEASGELFHVFHPAHILFSAVATTAMFWKHDNRNWLKAAVVGVVGSLGVCGLSDVIVPFVGGLTLGQDMHFHLCLIEEPGLVYPFALVGVLAGFGVTKGFDKSTEYSHGTHVFLSSVASLLYLVSFGVTHWIHILGGVFIVTLIAVVFPCTVSDIAFPMLCTQRYCQHPDSEIPHGHS